MSNKNNLTDFFAWVIVIGLLSIPCFCVAGCMVGCSGIEYSEGERAGVVYKISKKGLVWKTWEGQLSLGLNERDSEGAIVAKVFNFTVQDETLAAKIQKAAESGRRVTLKYNQKIFRGCSYGSTGYDVIEVIESGSGK